MEFLAAELYPLIEVIDYPERFVEPGMTADNLRLRAESLLRDRWKIVESNIMGEPYCVATGFSVTDLYITKLGVWLDQGWKSENLPRIEAIFREVKKRPALKEVWARHIR